MFLLLVVEGMNDGEFHKALMRVLYVSRNGEVGGCSSCTPELDE